MAANVVFVDEGTTDEVFGGEESDLDENMNNSESSEEEDDRREEDGDGEEESEEEAEEDNWVLGVRILRRLNFTADWGWNVELPDNPSFYYYYYYFHLLFPENLFDVTATQTNKYATETIACLRRRDGHLNTRGLEITHFTVVCLIAKPLSGVRLMLTCFSNANYFVIMLIRFWSLSQRGYFRYSLTQKDLATKYTMAWQLVRCKLFLP